MDDGGIAAAPPTAGYRAPRGRAAKATTPAPGGAAKAPPPATAAATTTTSTISIPHSLPAPGGVGPYVGVRAVRSACSRDARPAYEGKPHLPGTASGSDYGRARLLLSVAPMFSVSVKVFSFTRLTAPDSQKSSN